MWLCGSMMVFLPFFHFFFILVFIFFLPHFHKQKHVHRFSILHSDTDVYIYKYTAAVQITLYIMDTVCTACIVYHIYINGIMFIAYKYNKKKILEFSRIDCVYRETGWKNTCGISNGYIIWPTPHLHWVKGNLICLHLPRWIIFTFIMFPTMYNVYMDDTSNH